MGSEENWDNSKCILFGIPMDFTVSFRSGTRQGPQSVREVSEGIEDYSPYLDRSFEDIKFFDAGNLDLPFGNVEKSLKVIRAFADAIHAKDKFPLAIGGEHLVSLPLIKAASQKYPNMKVFQFDAHADLRQDYCDEPYSHACVMRRILDFISPKDLYQFGIRSGTKEEFMFGKKETNFHPFLGKDKLKEVLSNVNKKDPIYITIDIDVIDPAFAPGTGTPEPGGYTSTEIFEIIHLFKDHNIVAFDIVELLPSYDLSLRTSLLVAKIIREVMLTYL